MCVCVYVSSVVVRNPWVHAFGKCDFFCCAAVVVVVHRLFIGLRLCVCVSFCVYLALGRLYAAAFASVQNGVYLCDVATVIIPPAKAAGDEDDDDEDDAKLRSGARHTSHALASSTPTCRRRRRLIVCILKTYSANKCIMFIVRFHECVCGSVSVYASQFMQAL